jgi:AhpD family alkylhydroperoxidase
VTTSPTSTTASTANGVRGNRECDRHRVDPHAALLLNLEAGCLNGGRRVASRVAPAERAWPEEPVHQALTESERRPVREYMLVEEQFAAGAEHAPQLGERVRLVGHRAEDEASDGAIARRILGGQVVGDAVENLDPNVGSRGAGRTRSLAQIRLRLHGQHLLDRGRIVGEVAARTRTDLDHAARQPSQKLVPVAAYLCRLMPAHQRPKPREYRMVHGGRRHGGVDYGGAGIIRRVSVAAPARTGPRLFNSPWEAVHDLAAVTRRAKPLAAVYARGRLDDALRERVMLAVSRVNACRGCTFVHTRWALRSGVTTDELDAIGLDDLARLDRRSRAAVVYAIALAETRFRSSPPPDVAAAVAAELTSAEIEAVEAVARMMALANLTASTAEALLGRIRPRPR